MGRRKVDGGQKSENADEVLRRRSPRLLNSPLKGVRSVEIQKTKASKSPKIISEIVAPKRPPKFSYVVEDLLAGHGRPTLPGHVQYLCDEGFSYIVTLTQNKPRALVQYPGKNLEWMHIPVQDETPPTLEQIWEFVKLVDEAKEKKTKVSVHCAWGRGRTGTMCACYLLHEKDLSANDAIAKIRILRPGSIDTEKQINSVKSFAQDVKNRK
ncbi:hypothetical protein CAPTEDRAFT_166952 [Capitella teleta]|uniref:Dual specificity protein phosphatase 23 n=1 Tax=Capitella teleta TaxID=283909 RepID=R7UCB8_CAPTE|nr:hypothetical protein CAPTEDRAFT_166952 [Capitella teleta]|eukprot:ELU03644.1 hypothetical protein CAPTEDRAFT_166952 [Capitella teleta]